MASIQAEQLNDLVKNTLNDLGKPDFTENASDIQDHVAFHELFDRENVSLKAGPQVQWNVLVNFSNAAANVGLFAVDNVNTMDGMVQAYVPWRHTNTNYAIDQHEVSMNGEPAKIVDLLKERRIMALGSLAEKMEQNFWKFPSASDTTTPLGIPYWNTKYSGTPGFNAGNLPSGYSDVAGLSPTTYPRWNPWAGLYTAVSHDDLIRKMREAFTKTMFKPAVKGTPTFNTGDKYGVYTNYSVLRQLEEEAEQQNDNLGSDLASYDGTVTVRRCKVQWVPFLDLDTTAPVIGLNWGVIKCHILRGWWLRETSVPIAAKQHNVSEQWIDCSYNIICKDRRRLFNFATAATYSY